MTLKSLLFATALTATACSALVGCEKEEAAVAAKELSVDELSTMLESEKPPQIYDANGPSTRSEFGTVPGAKLLSSYDEYDEKELAADKSDKLVFYCGSTACSAAEGAATRAQLAGYTDVNVMPAGIKGWTKAGKPTSKVN